ncbi:MAG: STAS domain-containing protein [Alphaproteobacteria bacterium]|nr:STAS domain-containing protein [Alphaproteobacteria bacterium]
MKAQAAAKPSGFRIPFATALVETFREGYTLDKFKRDLVAAFIVSLVALPLSMALSIAVGLPPQHGLYTAIVAGIVTALLGGSRMQVSGPTAAFVVILAPIVAEYGLHGLIWCQLLAGAFLLVFAFARVGKLISYVPYPVTTGFTAGIAVILGTISLNDFLGLGLNLSKGHFPEKLALLADNIGNISLYETAVGLVALLLIIYGKKIISFVPSTILGVGAAIGLSMYFAHIGHPVVTIASKFSYVALDGSTQPGIPPYAPTIYTPTHEAGQWYSIPTLAEWRVYFYPALVIALLAALESLLSATVADSMARTKHDPNAELWGIGFGNIASGFCAGIPATGAIARTAALINNGAVSPIGSAMHAVLILAYMMALAPYIGEIPMAALAAILIHTAYRMSHWHQFVHTIKIAPKSDVMVLLTCFALTVAIDMVAGVSVGLGMAALLLMKQVTEMTSVKLEGHGVSDTGVEEAAKNLPRDVMVYRISGPLFFSTAEKVMEEAHFLLDHVKVLVIDLTDVAIVDMTGLVALQSLIETVSTQGRRVVLAGQDKVLKRVRKKLEGTAYETRVDYVGHLTDVLNALGSFRSA